MGTVSDSSFSTLVWTLSGVGFATLSFGHTRNITFYISNYATNLRRKGTRKNPSAPRSVYHRWALLIFPSSFNFLTLISLKNRWKQLVILTSQQLMCSPYPVNWNVGFATSPWKPHATHCPNIFTASLYRSNFNVCTGQSKYCLSTSKDSLRCPISSTDVGRWSVKARANCQCPQTRRWRTTICSRDCCQLSAARLCKLQSRYREEKIRN